MASYWKFSTSLFDKKDFQDQLVLNVVIGGLCFGIIGGLTLRLPLSRLLLIILNGSTKID